MNEAAGLKPIMPDGAMYMMIAIDIENFPEFEDDLQFVQALVKEQSVFCLPGKCFDYPNYFRIVLTVPEEMVWEACTRIADFCYKHFKNSFKPKLIENFNWWMCANGCFFYYTAKYYTINDYDQIFYSINNFYKDIVFYL